MRLIDANALFDKAFEVWGTEVDGGETNLFMEMINNAPTITQPPNAPLTLEQLLEMDGEPVFIKNPEYWDCWALVKFRDKIMLTLNNGAEFPAELEFKCGGKAYRRKPEEGDK